LQDRWLEESWVGTLEAIPGLGQEQAQVIQAGLNLVLYYWAVSLSHDLQTDQATVARLRCPELSASLRLLCLEVRSEEQVVRHLQLARKLEGEVFPAD
jgi:hypothetical protein